MNKQLAKIKEASLEIQGACLTFRLGVDYEKGGMGNIGGMSLDTFSKEKNRRVGTAYGCEMIRRVLLQFGVDGFSEMVGELLWVHGEWEDFDFKVKGIQALHVDLPREPLIFADLFNEFDGLGELK